jgi:hypothetical protein
MFSDAKWLVFDLQPLFATMQIWVINYARGALIVKKVIPHLMSDN